MPRNLARLVAKGTVGFLLGLALWWGLSEPYTRVLAAASEPLIRLAERPPVTHVLPRGTELTIDRDDFPRSSPRPALRTMDITFNVILLMTLFAATGRPLTDRNVAGLLGASVALVFVHVAAVVTNVQSIYALRLGRWSEVHYGAVARNFWGAAAHFYSLVGVFGAAVALWWLFRPAAGEGAEPRVGRRHKRRTG